MYRKILLVTFLIGLGGTGQAQLRNSNLVFGSGVWLNIGPETVISELMPDTVSQRNACISDTAGQFLLLADDFGIRNAIFETVQGGSVNDLAWNVPAGNYLILPVPGSIDHYAVFINELPPSARAGFVEVDMGANSGAGAVIGNGTTWFMEHTTAKISATMDATGTGYWVVLHTDDDDAFHAFHLSGTGLDPDPVTSQVGTTYLPSTFPKDNLDRRGQMTFSLQGDRLGVVKNDVSIDTSKIELFNFDTGTGVIQFWTEIGMALGIDNDGTPFPAIYSRAKGLNFDNSGQFLYINLLDTVEPFVDEGIVQLDLTATPPDSLWSQSATFTGFGPTQPNSYDSRYGSNFTVDAFGFLLAHPWYPPNPGYQTQLLEREFLPLGGFGNYQYPQSKVMGGFPSPCKRYLDSAPLATGICEAHTIVAIGLRPNPMIDRAALVFNGTARPERVIWRDALGRMVRRSAVGQVGPTYTLEREGVPAGLYMVEVLGKKGTLGVVKVICE
ncbi:MAG: hypothetical protein IPI05_02750 [Flavobacteriales bacterium]|nr:hypothetical protein [Flavobacteriales bacterium]